MIFLELEILDENFEKMCFDFSKYGSKESHGNNDQNIGSRQDDILKTMLKLIIIINLKKCFSKTGQHIILKLSIIDICTAVCIYNKKFHYSG